MITPSLYIDPEDDENDEELEERVSLWFADLCARTIKAAKEKRVEIKTSERREMIDVTSFSDITVKYVPGRVVEETVNIKFQL